MALQVTGTLQVRARLVPAPEPRFERLYDPLLDALAHDGPLPRERFATRWRDDEGLRRLADAKRAPLPPELLAQLTDYHRRLGQKYDRAAARPWLPVAPDPLPPD